MINKNKLIDCFLFYDELDMLEFRLTELNDDVDYFVILESNFDFKGKLKESLFKLNEGRYDEWKEKIVFVDCPELTPELIDEYKQTNLINLKNDKTENNVIDKNNIIFYMTLKLREKLISLELDYEDIVMFSHVDEIPNIRSLSSLNDYLSFSPVILIQKRFFWSTKYVDKDVWFGTSCHQYTGILQSPLQIHNIYNMKSKRKFSNPSFLDGGWHFSHFEDIGKVHKKLELINDQEYSIKDLKIKMNNLIPIKYPDLRDEYSLIDYDGDLPKNIHLLPEQPVRRTWNRNILIKTDDIVNNGVFFKTINVSFVNGNIKKIDKHTIILPQNILYGDYKSLEDFQIKYGYNELKKLIKNLYLLNGDTVTFDFGTSKSFTWGEIKDKYISDLI